MLMCQLLNQVVVAVLFELACEACQQWYSSWVDPATPQEVELVPESCTSAAQALFWLPPKCCPQQPRY